MPPADRFVCRFAAEPPQEPAPYGRWADTLREHFLAACLEAAPDERPGDLVFHPDRTYSGRTYVPIAAPTEDGGELFGFVSFAPGDDGAEADHFYARADHTEETAEANPDWKLDLSDEEIGVWRGEEGKQATMTLVWGRPLVPGGVLVTAELADLAVDQCVIVDGRFSLIAADDYRGDLLEVKLWTARGELLARESLYTDDEDTAPAED